MRYILIILLWLASSVVFAQEDMGSITVEVSDDTLYLGNAVGIKYSIKNIVGDFQPPEFKGMRLVAGPMVSSSFSMINGKVTQLSLIHI